MPRSWSERPGRCWLLRSSPSSTLEAVIPLRPMRSGRLAHAGRNLVWVGAARLTNALLASLLVTKATSLATQRGWGLLPPAWSRWRNGQRPGVVLLEVAGYPLHILRHRVYFGSVFTFADRLFGTFRVTERDGLRSATRTRAKVVPRRNGCSGGVRGPYTIDFRGKKPFGASTITIATTILVDSIPICPSPNPQRQDDRGASSPQPSSAPAPASTPRGSTWPSSTCGT
jgi:hypothetical protein